MDKLAAVREKFILSLQDKATELEAAAAGGEGDESLETLRAIVHKIAGSAGFYGQSDIAELATFIDGELQPPNDAILSVQLDPEIRKLAELMRHA